jgi:hypothetical protein
MGDRCYKYFRERVKCYKLELDPNAHTPLFLPCLPGKAGTQYENTDIFQTGTFKPRLSYENFH